MWSGTGWCREVWCDEEPDGAAEPGTTRGPVGHLSAAKRTLMASLVLMRIDAGRWLAQISSNTGTSRSGPPLTCAPLVTASQWFIGSRQASGTRKRGVRTFSIPIANQARSVRPVTAQRPERVGTHGHFLVAGRGVGVGGLGELDGPAVGTAELRSPVHHGGHLTFRELDEGGHVLAD